MQAVPRTRRDSSSNNPEVLNNRNNKDRVDRSFTVALRSWKTVVWIYRGLI
jgi:hypothetical protein